MRRNPRIAFIGAGSTVFMKNIVGDALRRKALSGATIALDPHTAAELDLDQIWELTSQLIEAHGEWLPEWLRSDRRNKASA